MHKPIYPKFAHHSALISLLHQLANPITSSQENALEQVKSIITDAIHKRASDIHLEPLEFQYRIRLRIDGVLHTTQILKKETMQAITSTLKIMAKLDIAEKRKPQDGRFSFCTDKKITRDCRLSSCATLHGEKIAIRLLHNHKTLLNIEQLGMEDLHKQYFLEALQRPQGLILVTGPTGSGKTVTLYTALDLLNKPEKNISTIEEPVEIKLAGINQVQINAAAGIDFALILRTFLRQDPDIIMIGEIRDSETADIALKAAQTGHLVLATLHTTDTVETLARLENMGIAPHLIRANTILIIAQRLLRKLCSHCKESQEDGYFHAKGCSLCYGGYAERIAIYEFLPLLQKNIAFENARTNTLREAALAKAKQGITSLAEVYRVT